MYDVPELTKAVASDAHYQATWCLMDKGNLPLNEG